GRASGPRRRARACRAPPGHESRRFPGKPPGHEGRRFPGKPPGHEGRRFPGKTRREPRRQAREVVMAGQRLHEYDKQLCNYAVDTVLQYEKLARRQPAPALRASVWAVEDPAVDRERLLLSDDEWKAPAVPFRCSPSEFAREGGPYESLHRR